MKRITVIAEDKVGVLADISYLLGKSKINIDSIDVEVIGGKAIITIITKDEGRATQLLQKNNYKVYSSEIVTVRLADEPGELSKVSKKLLDEGVNIESVHLLARGKGTGIYALSLDNMKKGKKILQPFIKKE